MPIFCSVEPIEKSIGVGSSNAAITGSKGIRDQLLSASKQTVEPHHAGNPWQFSSPTLLPHANRNSVLPPLSSALHPPSTHTNPDTGGSQTTKPLQWPETPPPLSNFANKESTADCRCAVGKGYVEFSRGEVQGWRANDAISPRQRGDGGGAKHKNDEEDTQAHRHGSCSQTLTLRLTLGQIFNQGSAGSWNFWGLRLSLLSSVWEDVRFVGRYSNQDFVLRLRTWIIVATWTSCEMSGHQIGTSASILFYLRRVDLLLRNTKIGLRIWFVQFFGKLIVYI